MGTDNLLLPGVFHSVASNFPPVGVDFLNSFIINIGTLTIKKNAHFYGGQNRF
jgi:hypothetical protein